MGGQDPESKGTRGDFTGGWLMRLVLMTLLGMALTGPLAAQHKKQWQPTRDQCICIAACRARENPGRMISQPGYGCPHIRDELIMDNMARCKCPAWTPKTPAKPEPGRPSPNH